MYWSGVASVTGADANNNWSFGSALIPSKSNWSTTINGTTDPVQVPGSISDVFFTAANATSTAGSLLTQIDGLYSVKSLTFDTSPQNTAPITGVTIGTNGNTLNLGSGGLAVASSNNSNVTISGVTGAVQINASQTWSNNSNSSLFSFTAPLNGTAATSATQTLSFGGTGAGGVALGGVIGNGSSGGKLALLFNQAGASMLSGNNTFTGGVTLHSNTLVAGSAGAFNSTTPNTLSFDASSTGKLQLAGTSTTVGSINSNAILGSPSIENGTAGAATLTTGPSGTGTFAGVIQDGAAGTLALAMAGSGTQTITGANTFTGGTTFSAGTLSFANGSLGTIGALTMNGGTLQWNGSNTQDISGRVTLVSAKAAGFDTNGNAITFGTALSGAGNPTKIGAGTLSLTAANTYTGSTAVTGGTLRISGSGSLGSGTYTGTIGLATGTTLQYSSSATETLSGIISGAGGLTKDTSTNTLILTGANTYTGPTTISSGILQLGTPTLNGATGATAYSIASGSTLFLNYLSTLTASNPPWAKITGAGALQLRSAQGANGAANWSSSGQIALTAGFTGTLQLDNGRIDGTPAGFGGATNIVLNDGSQFLAFDGQVATPLPYTFPQNFTVTGLNGFGESGFNLGVLRISGMLATFSGNITLGGPTAFYIQGGSNATMNVTGVISDGGSNYGLTINSVSNFIQLSNANTYGGATTVPSPFTLKLGHVGGIPSGTGKGNVSLLGTLDLNGFSGTVNGLAGSGTVTSTVATPRITFGRRQ